MSVLLSEDDQLLRANAERLGKEFGGAARLRAVQNAPAGIDDDALRRLGADGWLSLLVSQRHGGADLGVYQLCLVAEAFGRSLLSLPYAPAGAALKAMTEGWSVDSNNRLQSPLSGEVLILPAYGGDPGMSVTCEPAVPDGFRLFGGRPAVPGAGAASAFVVEATSGDTPVLAVVSRDCPGVVVHERRAIDGTTLGNLHFEGVIIPGMAVLATADDARRLRNEMEQAVNLGLAAELVGIMDEALSRTLDYMKIRAQFGRLIGSFQALQHKAVDAYTLAAMTRFLVFETARLADSKSPHALLLSCAAKAKAAEAALTVTKSMIQLHGAIGFTDECDIGLFLKRALTVASQYGTAVHHRRRVAAREAGEDESIFARFRHDAPEDAIFRSEVRDWLTRNLPQRLRDLPTRPSFEEQRGWHRQLSERGWIAPNWPREYGGLEASVAQRMILEEELAKAGAPEISNQAIYHIGPILIEYGTPEQKAKHLPGMLSGDVIWCQGYSEPGSGSDLASLRTKAVRDGNSYVVNGQKIWTTGGYYAEWMFALVRTNPNAPKKQEGISLILIDMTTPGIRRRPIRTIAGEDELAEVFFDDVRVPAENIVGKVDDGWRLANEVLAQERTSTANPHKCIQLLWKVRCAAAATGLLDDPAYRDRLAHAEIDLTALCAAYAHLIALSRAGKVAAADVGFAKITSSELQQALCDLLIEACNGDAAIAEPLSFDGGRVDPARTFMQNRRVTIYAGTVEIQRNIIAKRVLGLP